MLRKISKNMVDSGTGANQLIALDSSARLPALDGSQLINVPGSRGETGPAGQAGSRGETGPAGLAGAAGQAGSRGETGPAGAAGQAGSRGETGPAGAAGQAGQAGQAGSRGETGLIGPTGALVAFTGLLAPSGYILANGQRLNSVDDITLADLFALWGTLHGGTGDTNFNAPDFRGRYPLGTGAYNTSDSARPSRVVGTKDGSRFVSRESAPLPEHRHDYHRGFFSGSPGLIRSTTGGDAYSYTTRTTSNTGVTGTAATHLHSYEPIHNVVLWIIKK